VQGKADTSSLSYAEAPGLPRSIRWTSRGQERSARPDVQAALTVVGRRDPGRDIQPIDLARANLNGATLNGARWPEGELVPEGWRLDTGSGRLEQAGTRPAEAD